MVLHQAEQWLANSKEWLYRVVFKEEHIPQTTQDSLHYIKLFENGIMQATDDCYSQTLAFADINFELESNDVQVKQFETWMNFLATFDEKTHISMHFISHKADMDELRKNVYQSNVVDAFSDVRSEFYDHLIKMLGAANNGFVKQFFITYSVRAKTYKKALPKLKQVEELVAEFLTNMGSVAYVLNGVDRAWLMHKYMHPNPDVKFDASDIDPEAHTISKSYIAPQGLSFKDVDTFRVNRDYAAVCSIQPTTQRLQYSFLRELLNKDYPIAITLHLEPFDKTEAAVYVRRKKVDIEGMVAESQIKAFQGGYGMELLPDSFRQYMRASEMYQQAIENGENLYKMSLLAMYIAPDLAALEENIASNKKTISKHNCKMERLPLQQESGLTSMLPIGVDKMMKKSIRTTQTASAMFPFRTAELFQKGAQSLYYGVNGLTEHVIFLNRKTLTNPNGIVTGVPGSGKSFFVKREIANIMLFLDDDILIFDPESEYKNLVNAFNGSVVVLSESSATHINPMDIVLDYGTEAEPNNPVGLKAEFTMALFNVIVRGSLNDTESTLIVRCVEFLYEDFLKRGKCTCNEDMPLLSDLKAILDKQPEEQAKRLSVALEMYTSGSFGMFNHHTNINYHGRLVCFDAKGLRESLRPLAMLIMQDQIWGRVSINRKNRKGTWTYFDEFQIMMRYEQTAEYSVEMYKRFRKWRAIPTVMTQNIKDFKRNAGADNILENSKFLVMLDQAPDDRKHLAEARNISPAQIAKITNAKPGCGLLFFDETVLSFKDNFPMNTQLYKLMTTRPSDEMVI